MDNTVGYVLLEPETKFTTGCKLLQLFGLMLLFVGILIYVTAMNKTKCDFDVSYSKKRY